MSENSTHHYLPDWTYLGQKSGKNIMKECYEHKINAIFELATLENPYVDSLFNIIYEFLKFQFLLFFGVISLIGPNWGDNLRLVASRGW